MESSCLGNTIDRGAEMPTCSAPIPSFVRTMADGMNWQETGRTDGQFHIHAVISFSCGNATRVETREKASEIIAEPGCCTVQVAEQFIAHLLLFYSSQGCISSVTLTLASVPSKSQSPGLKVRQSLGDTMCEAFSSRGSDPHKMVARSISARLGGFESAVHTTFRRRRTLSSTATSVDDFDGSGRRALSCEYDEGYAESKEEQAKIWERCSIGPTQIQIRAGDTVASQTKGSKWKRFVQNLKSHVRNWGHHPRPFSHIEYLYSQSFCAKNFDDGNCRQIQWTVSNTSRESVWTAKLARSASAVNSSAHNRIPIWQRRNRSPIPPVHIPNARRSRTKSV